MLHKGVAGLMLVVVVASGSFSMLLIVNAHKSNASSTPLIPFWPIGNLTNSTSGSVLSASASGGVT